MSRSLGWRYVAPAAVGAVRRGFLSRRLPDLSSVLRPGPVTPLGPRVLVVSPHPDDAVLSLGATMSHHRRGHGHVTLLTVFSGDPTSTAPAGAWDGRAGFTTAGEASAWRRREDAAACAVLDVTLVELHEHRQQDGEYSRRRVDERVAAAMSQLADRHDEVLVPGYPLSHPDHEYVTRLAFTRLHSDHRVRLYAEEPYTSWTRRAGPAPGPDGASPHVSATWGAMPFDWTDQVRKVRAAGQYRSQLPLLATSAGRGPGGAPATSLLGLLWWEAMTRGELVSDVVQR